MRLPLPGHLCPFDSTAFRGNYNINIIDLLLIEVSVIRDLTLARVGHVKWMQPSQLSVYKAVL